MGGTVEHMENQEKRNETPKEKKDAGPQDTDMAFIRAAQDAALLQDEDLQESLEQMRRGEGKVVRQRPAPPAP